MHSRTLATVAMLGVLSLPASVRGQQSDAGGEEASPAPADPAKVELARKHYELGEQLYNTSNYPAALAEFKKAYALAGRPELLFNIARCHEVMAELEPAVASYERYLEQRPDAANAGLVRSRLANLRQRLAERKQQENQTRQAEQASRAPQPPPTPAEPASRWKRTTGWVLVGVGAASLGTGIAFGVLARNKADDFEAGVAADKPYYELDSIDEDGKRFNTIAIATLATGGVVLAARAGLVPWDLLSAGKQQGSAALVAPFASASGGGLAASVQF